MSFEEQAQRVTDALAERVREHVARELQAAADELRTMLASERAADEARTAEQLRVGAVRAAEAQLAAITAAETRGIETARAMADRAHWPAGERLLEAFRRLDAAQSLSQIFDRLADAAAHETARVAVLTVRGDAFHAWKCHGFDPASLALEHADSLADVVRSGRQRIVVSAAREATPIAGPRDGDGKLLILPITVGDTVVALVCADLRNDEKDDQEGAIAPLMVELLARHAARSLEAVTATRTAQLMDTGN